MPTVITQHVTPHEALRASYLGPDEVELWHNVRTLVAHDAIWFAFGVTVGPEPEVPPNILPRLAEAWKRQNQRRIDVLVKLPEGVAILELKPYATPSAIGQLKLYDFLYTLDPVAGPVSALYLVARYAPPDIVALAKADNIRILIPTLTQSQPPPPEP
jgi:hypothetical protein